jgi:hypothetical protein
MNKLEEITKELEAVNKKFDLLEWKFSNPRKFVYGDKVRAKRMERNSYNTPTTIVFDEFDGIILDEGTVERDNGCGWWSYVRWYQVASDKHKAIKCVRESELTLIQ